MSRLRRLLALAGCMVLVLAAACDRDQPQTTDEPTEEPTPSPSVESLGEFQLVAVIEQAFLSIEPGIDLPAAVTQQTDAGDEQQAAGVSGVMRGAFEAFSDNLGQQCNADEGDRFNLYWTPGTLFDRALTNRGLELSLDGRRVGVIGTMFRTPEAGDTGVSEDFDLDQQTAGPTTAAPATTTPVASPGVTTSEGEDGCILVVEQVGISRGGLPTARPTRAPARTATPSPTPPRTPTPTPRRTPTPSPSPTDAPTETPEDSPTESPEDTPDADTEQS